MASSVRALLPVLFALLSLTTSSVLASPHISARHSSAPQSRSIKRDNVTPLTFEVVGESGVSAQMMFLGTEEKVYILDKTENNPLTVTGADGTTHPAWATEYDIASNTYRAMDVQSNTFCAGGFVLGNGTWAIFGGNQPVTTDGVASTSAAAYDDTDGGTAIRLLNPASDGSAEYIQGTQPYSNTGDTNGWLQMTGRRWYPMIEGLADGSVIVIGGDKNGGYVNTKEQDNPTYEFFPPTSEGAVNFTWLSDTLPINLYALTWLLPDGRLFMQANRSTILYDYNSKEVTNLPDMPYAARVYPASAANAMLPLTPANNYTPTILFCGGSNPPQWGDDGSPRYNVTAVPADNTCVRINPMDDSPTYEDDDYLDQGRSMGQFAYLPDGTLWMGNGVAMGTAGYGNQNYSVGQSFGQDPIFRPSLYNPNNASGSRWTFDLANSTEERMYHSTVVLLPDGSLLISGSNPNADYTTEQWGTKYSVERWYPSWYNEERPVFNNPPSTLTYGGDYFNVSLSNITDEETAKTAKVVVIRGGFSTHAFSMGQKYLELNSTYLVDTNVGTTLFVSQMPPNANIFQPGPAMIFLVVNGVPSTGKIIMIGSGAIETQTVNDAAALPVSSVYTAPTVDNSSVSASESASATGSSSTGTSNASSSSAGFAQMSVSSAVVSLVGMVAAAGLTLLA